MSTRSVRYSTLNRSIRKGNLASTDRDALAFLEAAQIYNTNQQRAIVNLVRSLKRVGLWSKMKAIYPFVGGTASAHKWNLKDPRDVDAAFRLTFSGGWTHSSTGADPNGTNGYADTYLVPLNNLTNNNTHISTYVRQLYAVNNIQTYVIGCYDGDTSYNISISTYKTSGGQAGMGVNGGCNISADLYESVTSEIGLFIVSNRSTSSNDHEAYRNSTSIKTNTSVSATRADSKMFVGALNYNDAGVAPVPLAYTNQELAFATIGDGLTDTDATNLYNIVDLYQKRLGRAV